MPMEYHFDINTDCKIEKIPIEGSDHFYVVVDDLLSHPEEVCHLAKYNTCFSPIGTDGSYYPGVRDDMPGRYEKNLNRFLQPLIEKFYFDGIEVESISPKSFLSLTTLEPGQLHLGQRVPHTDTLDQNGFAAVHYLCGEEHGGTSIYRFRPADVIQITEDMMPEMGERIFECANAAEEEHQGYLSESTSVFEKVASVKAKFNRLVFYKGNLLHGADITSPKSHSSNLDEGRLSVTSFLTYKARP